MWVIFITYFCTASICNSDTTLDQGFKSRAQCETARTALAAGKHEFITEGGKPKAVPLSVTSCRQR